jgi:hypothetical protein
MPPIVASTEVDRPAAEVYAHATDPTRFSEWQKGVIDGHMESAGTPTVGTRCLTTRRIGGANRPVTSQLVHIDPLARGAFAASTGRSALPWMSRSNRWRMPGRG